MISEEEVLSKLDYYKLGYYCQFIYLGDGYSYLIDCRLNVFRGDNDRWAIAAERLGYNPRADAILLDICYYGNCLSNLEHYNGNDINYYSVYPVDAESFNESVEGETLLSDARHWIVRGQKIKLSHEKQDYFDAGIKPNDNESNEIRVEEAARLAIIEHGELFRATDAELYKSIPRDLQKILVIDEWYHKDFIEVIQPVIDDEHLKEALNINELIKEQLGMDDEALIALVRQQEERNKEFNESQWEDNRPSSYETWQLLAKVIATGDASYYKPTLEPNTHWRNWPDSGSL